MHRQYYGICVVKTVYACKLYLHGQSKTVYAKARGGHGPHMLIQKQNVKCVPSFSLSFATVHGCSFLWKRFVFACVPLDKLISLTFGANKDETSQ